MGSGLKLLLDTHALLWWFSTSPSMSSEARVLIEGGEVGVWVSAVSAFEIATKYALGKLPEGAAFAHDFQNLVESQEFTILPIDVADACRAGSLPFHHKDTFDRLLIAQALERSMTLISNETLFDRYGVARLW